MIDRLMIDRLRQLAIFAKTIDHGSFRGAASELNLSPSVVSHHVSELEAHLGVALIYRSTRKLTLTKEGERLLSTTRKMLDAVGGTLQDISGTSREPSGELRLTIPSLLSQSFFTDAIAEFVHKFPDVKLSLDYSDTRKELIDHGFDIAIRISLNVKSSSASKKLFTIRRKLVASRKYLKTQPDLNELKNLKDSDWLVLSQVHNRGISFTRRDSFTQRGGEKLKIKPKTRISSNDSRSLFRLVSADLGVAALPEFIVANEVESGNMEYVMPQWELEPLCVFAEWSSNAPKHGLVKLLINELSKDTSDIFSKMGTLR